MLVKNLFTAVRCDRAAFAGGGWAMRGLAFTGALSALVAVAGVPAQAAYLFDENGDSADIVFDGFSGNSANTIPGLSASCD